VVVKLLRIQASVYMASEPGKKTDPTVFDGLSEELNRLRSDYPGRVDIRTLQAFIAMQRAKPQEAERELKLAIEECDEPLRAEIELVRYYYQAKRMPEAVEAGRAACDRHGELAEPWISLSELYQATHDYDAARACLEQGQETAVGKWEQRSLTLRRAVLELVQGKDQAAGIDLLQGLADRDPQEIYGRTLLLSVPEVRDDTERSEKLVEQLQEAEGQSGLQWRFHKASLGLSAPDWRTRQQDISDLLQYCIDSDPEWSAPVLLLADMYENMGDSKRVEEICKQALSRSPSSTDVADRLVSLFEKQGRYVDAEQVLQQIQADPRVASAWQVRIALGAGDFSRAIEELKLRVANDDRDANSRILLARLVYWQTRDRDRALAYLDQAQAITPNALTAIAARVSILNAEGQAAEAQKIVDDYVASTDTFGAYMIRASLLARAGELDRAAEDYRKLTTFENEQHRVIGYDLLSRFYTAYGAHAEAVKALDEGLTVFSEDSRFHSMLQRRLLKTLLGQSDPQSRERALDLLAELETQFGSDPELMKLRAFHMLDTGTPSATDIDSARAKLEEVTKLEPTAVDAHLTLVNIAMRRSEFEAARDYAVNAIGANPNAPTLTLARGWAELALENTAMALELAQMTIEKDPNNSDALYLLVSAAVQGSDPARLKEVAARIDASIQGTPTNERLLVARAEIHIAMNTPEQAIPELEAYTETPSGSRSIAALVTLADLYRLSGDLARCGQRVESAATLDPNSLAVIHSRVLWWIAEKRYGELVDVSSHYRAVERPDPATLKKAVAVMVASESPELRQEGVELAEYLVTLSPDSLEARQIHASCLYQVGHIEQARAAYETLLEEHPNDIRVLNDLAWIIQEQSQEHETALALVDRGLKLSPGDLNLLDTRGTILLNMPNRLVDARAVFERLVALSKAQSRRKASALLKLGRTLVRLEDLAQASQTVKRAADIDQEINVFTEAERAEIQQIILQSGLRADR
jgi:tetratricopeptide (TPR) repeat protein